MEECHMEWSNKTDWNESLDTWGTLLRSLAQGGLLYSEGGETDLVRYRRMQEIAQALLDGSHSVSDEQVRAMADDLRGRVPSLTEEQADALARELLGKQEGVGQEQVRAWGVELLAMADASLEDGLENLYDVGRYEVVRDLGRKMRDLDI